MSTYHLATMRGVDSSGTGTNGVTAINAPTVAQAGDIVSSAIVIAPITGFVIGQDITSFFNSEPVQVQGPPAGEAVNLPAYVGPFLIQVAGQNLTGGVGSTEPILLLLQRA